MCKTVALDRNRGRNMEEATRGPANIYNTTAAIYYAVSGHWSVEVEAKLEWSPVLATLTCHSPKMSPSRGAKGIEWGTILAGQGCFRQHNEPGQDLCTQVMAKQTATLSVALGLYTWRKTLSTKHKCARWVNLELRTSVKKSKHTIISRNYSK